jgi:hypothetical protein
MLRVKDVGLMRRLIYTSHAPRLLGQTDLQAILTVARERNAQDDITDLFVYHDGGFLQLLEGPDDVVADCFERIRKDRRHQGCIRVIDEVATSRIFADWRMAFQSTESLGADQLRQFEDIRQFAEKFSEDTVAGNKIVAVVVMAFLSGFRDLDVAV